MPPAVTRALSFAPYDPVSGLGGGLVPARDPYADYFASPMVTPKPMTRVFGSWDKPLVRQQPVAASTSGDYGIKPSGEIGYGGNVMPFGDFKSEPAPQFEDPYAQPSYARKLAEGLASGVPLRAPVGPPPIATLDPWGATGRTPEAMAERAAAMGMPAPTFPSTTLPFAAPPPLPTMPALGAAPAPFRLTAPTVLRDTQSEWETEEERRRRLRAGL